MKRYHLPWRHMNLVCGVNRKWFETGRAMTVGGLILAAVGYALTVDTVCRIDGSEPNDYDYAHEFVDACLG